MAQREVERKEGREKEKKNIIAEINNLIRLINAGFFPA